MNLILVTTLLLFLSKLEVLCSLQCQLFLGLARLTFQTQYNLTGSLGLFVEHWLSLSSETHLLRVVTPLSLGEVGRLAGLVLSNLVHLVLSAFPTGTISPSLLWYVNHL